MGTHMNVNKNITKSGGHACFGSIANYRQENAWGVQMNMSFDASAADGLHHDAATVVHL